MKQGIHPTYYPDATVICACGNTWTTGSTQKVIHTDVCFKCHPFYTGEQRIVDTEGQVERFYRKLEARKRYEEEKAAREAARISPQRPVSDFGLGKRAIEALAQAGITTAGDVLQKMEQGEQALLDIAGFGRKSLADLKKSMRKFGYTLPEAVEEASA
ncbi:MAG TPA: 50S ribosomal protein L31 [Chloroflexi bacterium]|nr:50S ribosomal protein L31 [Chloroflexota bacterium]